MTMHNCFKADEIGDQKAREKTPGPRQGWRCGCRAQERCCRQSLVGLHNWLDVGNARERGVGDE